MSNHLSADQYKGITKSLQRINISIHDLPEVDLHSIRVRVANNYQVYPGQSPPSPKAQQVIQILQRFQINLLGYRELLRRLEEAPDAEAPVVLADPLGEIGDIMERTRSYVGEMRLQVIHAIFGYIADKSVKPLKYQYVLEHFEYIDLADKLLEAGVSADHFEQYLETYHMLSVLEAGEQYP